MQADETSTAPGAPATQNRDVLSQIVALLQAEEHFVISTHMYPDGDAVGSELAMWHALRRMGKRATIVNHSPVSAIYDFLPGFGQLRALADFTEAELADLAGLPLLSLDCGRFDRLGDVPARLGSPRIVNIDHHVSNEDFGALNLVKPEASSAADLVLEIAIACGVELDLDLATCIYAAVVSDTGRFCYSNTSPRTHETAARLVALGVDPAEISRNLFRSRTLGQLRLHAMLIETLELSDDGRAAWASLTYEMCGRAGVAMIDTLDCVLLPISINGVELGLLFRELDPDGGQVKLSLRSEGIYDVSQLAARFGGGGHPCAAGCTLDGPLDAARARALDELLSAIAT